MRRVPRNGCEDDFGQAGSTGERAVREPRARSIGHFAYIHAAAQSTKRRRQSKWESVAGGIVNVGIIA